MEYRYPSYYCKHIDYDKLTEAQVQSLVEETIECIAHNRQAYAARCEARKQIITLLDQVYPGMRNAEKRKKAAKHIQIDLAPSLSEEEPKRRLATAKEAIAKAEREKEASAKQIELTHRAILWLEKRGKKLNEDFTVANAVDVANNIAMDEEIARQTAAGGLVEFCGSDDCENCGGWDMESRRCECGNRRVSWETGYGHSFENPYICAEAY